MLYKEQMDWQIEVLVKAGSKVPLWNNETFRYFGKDESLDQLLVDFAIKDDRDYPNLRQGTETEIKQLERATSKFGFVKLMISRKKCLLDQDDSPIVNHKYYNPVIKSGYDAVINNPTITFHSIIPRISELKQQLLNKEGVE